MGFITILWQYKSLIAIGILAAALAVMYGYLGIVKKDRDAAVSLTKSLRGELIVSQASVKTLSASIAEQNLKIDEFKSAADKRLEANKGNLASADASAGALTTDAGRILSRPMPKDATACNAASELFNEEIRNAKK